MKPAYSGLGLLIAIALSACGGTPTPSGPTPTPLAELGDEPAPTVTESVPLTPSPTADALTTPTTPEPEALPPGIVVYQAGDPASIVVVDAASGQTAPFLSPAPAILGSAYSVDALQGKLYAVIGTGVEGDPYVIAEITPAGPRTLIEGDTFFGSIAVQASAELPDVTLLAYATSDGTTERLQFVTVDGIDGGLVAESTGAEGIYFQPFRWSADGKRLFFSQERPVESDYSLLLGGSATLFRYDTETLESTTIIAPDNLPGVLCVDDVSPDERLVAHHCAGIGIGIVDIDEGIGTAVIQPPAELTDWTMLGSTRFSPDSSRIAFAALRGDRENEQGWVLVSDDLVGTSRLITSTAAGDYYTVEAWLDDNTLILQSHGTAPAVWLIRLDGSDPVKLTDGTFLALMR